MRKRWLGIFALCFFGAAARPALPLRADGQPDTPDEYVTVQLKGGQGAQAQMADGKPPTLEEQGFHSLPVPKGMSADDFLAQLRGQPTWPLRSATPGSLPPPSRTIPSTGTGAVPETDRCASGVGPGHGQ